MNAIPDPPRRLLIVRPSALGDVARTVPALVSLRTAFPVAAIDWLVNRPFADAIAAHPALSAVVPFERDRPAAAVALMRRLRAARYDAAYDLQGLARSGLFTRATGARRRVGFANARELAWLAYTHRHTITPTRHAVDRMLGLLEAEGVRRVEDMTLQVPAADDAWAAAQLADHAGPAVGLAPTAQWGSKCWPIERYAALAERVLATHADARVLVFAGGGASERARIAPLLAQLGPRVAAPRTSVGQLMGLIKRCRLVVCNDSAALHLAVGLNTSTVSLFGPTDPALVGPFGYDRPGSIHAVLRPADAPRLATDYRHRRDDDTLMRGLAVDTVTDAVLSRLS